MKAAGGDRPGTGTHLELESKLRACLVLGACLLWLPGVGGSSGRTLLFVADRLDKDGPYGVVLVVLSPEMVGGQPLFSGISALCFLVDVYLLTRE